MPGYFSGNGNLLRNQAKPNVKIERIHVLDPRSRSSLEISIYELWLKECRITDFGKQTKWRPESGPFESHTAEFSRYRHGSSTWNIFLRYFSKLLDIWHFTIKHNSERNCRDRPPIRSRNFPSSQCKQIMNTGYMHEICQNLLPFSTVF